MQVLVTRPQEDAQPLLALLRQRGFSPLWQPVLRIIYATDVAVDLTDVQGLLVTSANAVRALVQNIRNTTQLFEIPVFTVGDASAREARHRGFSQVVSAAGDVASLARLVRQQVSPHGGALLHPAGSKLAGDLAGELTAAGYTYRRVVLYQGQPVAHLNSETLAGFRDGKIAGVLFFSPRTAQTFANLVQQSGMTPMLGSVMAFCLSDAVARALQSDLWRALRVASRPTQESLLMLMEQTLIEQEPTSSRGS